MNLNKISKIFSVFTIFITLFVGSLSFLPLESQALALPGEDIICGGPCPLISGNFRFDRDGIVSFLVAISQFLTIIGVGLAVLFLVWSGVLYITGKAEEAQKGILNAIIGLLIIILAYTAVSIIIGLLSGTRVNVGNF
jgi:ABC-type phosphate transport system permease subunit